MRSGGNLAEGLQSRRVGGDHRLDPLHYSSAVGKGKNSYTFAYSNGLTLVNVMLNGRSSKLDGKVSVNNGKKYDFQVARGENKTLVIPAMVKDNKVTVNFEGVWSTSGMIMQPLMTPGEDYLFSRTYFNCGKAPWLLKELDCDPAAWKYFEDIHLRQARWLY